MFLEMCEQLWGDRSAGWWGERGRVAGRGWVAVGVGGAVVVAVVLVLVLVLCWYELRSLGIWVASFAVWVSRVAGSGGEDWQWSAPVPGCVAQNATLAARKSGPL